MDKREKFEKWYAEMKERKINVGSWHAWQAALSTRKPYGYGIVDWSGEAVLSHNTFPTLKGAQKQIETYSADNPDGGYRVVPLFYEDQ